MRDSDWSREILLRSDWSGLIGATITTTADNLELRPLSSTAPAQPTMGFNNCFFLWFPEIVGGIAIDLRTL